MFVYFQTLQAALNQLPGLYDDNPVAIKLLHLTDNKLLKDFEHECEIMRSAAMIPGIPHIFFVSFRSSVKSEHVIHFYGTLLVPKVHSCCVMQPAFTDLTYMQVCIVVEYCPGGSLFQAISDPATNVSWAKLLRVGVSLF